mgnify:FL=1
MKAEVMYKNENLGTIEGDTVKDIIEENFSIFKKYITDKAGNAAGYILEKAWIERINDSVCEFHVIAHGSDNLVNYDPTNDKSKEIIFTIFGISKENFTEYYEFEIEESKEFSPFDAEWFTDKSSIVGILEACVDFLAENSKAYKRYNYRTPSVLTSTKYPTMRDNNLPVYISQLMVCFGLFGVSKTNRNSKVFDLVEIANDSLVKMMEKDKESKLDASRLLAYHKTRGYFRKLGKVTALQYYRKKTGKTQQEIADSVGISLRQYQRYEAINSSLGDTKQPIIERIAETVGVTAEDIVKNGIVVLK